jgi:hypothetical protein
MRKESPTFGVALDNIPTINLRNEFVYHLHLMRQADFRDAFRKRGVIQTPFFTWHGSQEEALSLLVQRAIAGLEAWVAGAAWSELAATGRIATHIKSVRNPATLLGKGMAEKYYCSLPALVYEDAALDRADPTLWSRTQILYREIRNPLMHGYQIATSTVDGVLECFEHLARLFRWTDTWHDWIFQHPPKTPPVHIQARRLLLTLRPDMALDSEDVRTALGDFARDGRCSSVPEQEVATIRTLGDLLACARRYQIPPPSSA